MADPIMTLLNQYGSISAIPDEDLAAHGYEKVVGERGASLRKATKPKNDLENLVLKHGSAGNIPPESLAQKGLVWFEGTLRKRDSLTKKQLQQLEDPFLDEDDPVYQKAQQAQALFNHRLKGPAGQYLPAKKVDELRDSLEEYIRELTERFPEQFRSVADIDIEQLPQIGIITELNQYMTGKSLVNNEVLARAVIEEFEPSLMEYGKEWISRSSETIHKVCLKVTEETLADKEKVSALKERFGSLYGSSDLFGNGPFTAWVYGLVSTGSAPEHFWGRELYRHKQEFIKEFGNTASAEMLADAIFSEWSEVNFDYLYRPGGSETVSRERLLSDELPSAVEEFLGKRKRTNIARAIVETDGFSLEDYLRSDLKLMKAIKELYDFQNGDAKQVLLEKYSFLDGKTSNQRKEKLIRLCEQFPSFKDHVESALETQVSMESYVRQLPQNTEVTNRLRSLGVDTDIFYDGISDREVVVDGGNIIDQAEIRKGYMDTYRQTMKNIFSGSIAKNPNVLELKLQAEMKDTPYSSVTAETIMSTEDADLVKKVCAVTTNYLSRKQNTTDEAQAAAAAHHLRQVSKFLKGKVDTQTDSGNLYRFRLAKKDPLNDIDIGNDSGCCIGIYHAGMSDDPFEDIENEAMFLNYVESFGLEDVEPNGCYMPFYLKDKATQFVEVLKGGKRIGMALMFAAEKDGKSYLLVNSIEMGHSWKSDPNKQAVLRETKEYILDYAQESGFDHVLMGRHSYNPGLGMHESVELEGIKKIHPWNEGFYADTMDSSGNCHNSWVNLKK